MTKTIEQEALDRVNEDRALTRDRQLELTDGLRAMPAWKTICRAIEQLLAEREAHAATKAEYEAFRREVSDGLHHYFGPKLNDVAQGYLGRFIIPKPDPLAQVAREMVLLDGVVRTDNQKAAIREGRAANTAADDFYDRLRAALAARGLKLVEAGDAAA